MVLSPGNTRWIASLSALCLLLAPAAFGFTSVLVPGETKITPSDPAQGFGIRVAVSQDRMLVGAWVDDDQARNAGSAFFYRPDGSGGFEEVKLLASDGAAWDHFGRDVATDGTDLLVGAWNDDDQGESSGSAYLYEPDGQGGFTETKITPSDGQAGDQFGFGVAIDGGALLVGAGLDDDQGGGAGSAYLFEPDGQGGFTETKITASDGQPGDGFGKSVSMDGGTLLVGASGGRSAYLYQPDGTGGFTETKLTPRDGRAGVGFGESVAIDGGALLIGASTAAYLFQPDGSGGFTETKITASDGQAEDHFGHSVALSDGTLAIGAPEDDNRGHETGSVYVYREDGSGGLSETKLVPSDGRERHEFGWSVALDGDVLLVGATGPRDGSAYRYDLACWQGVLTPVTVPTSQCLTEELAG